MLIINLFYIISIVSACNIENCETCSINSYDICINCYSGYTRNEIYGCIQLPPYQQNQRDQIENCELYNQSSLCKKCSNGYILANNRCEPECEDHCTCFLPYICSFRSLAGNGCMDSVKGCKQCCDFDSSECCGCVNKLGIDKYGNCRKCITFGCLQCSADYKVCDVCESSFYIDSSHRCCKNQNCLDCSQDINACEKCSKGYFIKNGNCCPEHCLECDFNSTCTNCEKNHNLDEKNTCKYVSANHEKQSTILIIVGVLIFVIFTLLLFFKLFYKSCKNKFIGHNIEQLENIVIAKNTNRLSSENLDDVFSNLELKKIFKSTPVTRKGKGKNYENKEGEKRHVLSNTISGKSAVKGKKNIENEENKINYEYLEEIKEEEPYGKMSEFQDDQGIEMVRPKKGL